jgi:hypothetical protein
MMGVIPFCLNQDVVLPSVQQNGLLGNPSSRSDSYDPTTSHHAQVQPVHTAIPPRVVKTSV